MIVFLVRGRGAENIKKKKKNLKMKRNKNEEYRESQTTTMKIFGCTFHMKNHIFLGNIV